MTYLQVTVRVQRVSDRISNSFSCFHTLNYSRHYFTEAHVIGDSFNLPAQACVKSAHTNVRIAQLNVRLVYSHILCLASCLIQMAPSPTANLTGNCFLLCATCRKEQLWIIFRSNSLDFFQGVLCENSCTRFQTVFLDAGLESSAV